MAFFTVILLFFASSLLGMSMSKTNYEYMVAYTINSVKSRGVDVPTHHSEKFAPSPVCHPRESGDPDLL